MTSRQKVLKRTKSYEPRFRQGIFYLSDIRDYLENGSARGPKTIQELMHKFPKITVEKIYQKWKKSHFRDSYHEKFRTKKGSWRTSYTSTLNPPELFLRMRWNDDPEFRSFEALNQIANGRPISGLWDDPNWLRGLLSGTEFPKIDRLNQWLGKYVIHRIGEDDECTDILIQKFYERDPTNWEQHYFRHLMRNRTDKQFWKRFPKYAATKFSNQMETQYKLLKATSWACGLAHISGKENYYSEENWSIPIIEHYIKNHNFLDFIKQYEKNRGTHFRKFVLEALKDKLGGVEWDHDFIKDMYGLSDNQIYAHLGFVAEVGNETKLFTNILGLDIGTNEVFRKGMTEHERRQAIFNTKLNNIGWYKYGKYGGYIDPKLSKQQRLDELRKILSDVDLLVGHNIISFDLEVLKYHGLDIKNEFPTIKIYDVMQSIYGPHSNIRNSLSDLLSINGLPPKDRGDDRDVAAQNDSKAILGIFTLLIGPQGLRWNNNQQRITLKTTIFEGINKLWEVKPVQTEQDFLIDSWSAWITQQS